MHLENYFIRPLKFPFELTRDKSLMTWFRYWQGVGLVIYRSWVRVMAWHHCVVALGKLSPNSIIWYRRGWGGVICLAGKVTVGLVESNGSLPPGL